MSVQTALIFGLLAMLGFGLANGQSKPLIERYGPAGLLFLRGLTMCLVLTVVFLAQHVALPVWWLTLSVFAVGVLGYLPVLAFTHGVKVGRLSIVSPISGTAPLITVVLAVLFMHVVINGLQWLAVAAVIAANVAISVDLRDFRRNKGVRRGSGVPFGLLAAGGWGVYFFVVVYPTNAIGPVATALFTELGVTAAAYAHLRLTKQKVNWADAAKTPVVINGLLVVAGSLAYMLGVHHSPHVSIVAALSNSSAAVTASYATIFYKERLTRFGAIAAACMVAGIAVISLN